MKACRTARIIKKNLMMNCFKILWKQINKIVNLNRKYRNC